MTNISKIALGFGVTGIAGLSILSFMKQKKLAKQAFDAEIGEDEAEEMTAENDDESSAEDELPEFTKYTGIPVDTVTDMLNAVTHRGQDDDFYDIKSEDFEEISQSLGVSHICIRYNYPPTRLHRTHSTFERSGEMVTFRIRENYCVSNDSWFLISGTWKYLSKDEVFNDFIRCATCKERQFETDTCLIV
jgi:hypothetical protein